MGGNWLLPINVYGIKFNSIICNNQVHFRMISSLKRMWCSAGSIPPAGFSSVTCGPLVTQRPSWMQIRMWPTLPDRRMTAKLFCPSLASGSLPTRLTCVHLPLDFHNSNGFSFDLIWLWWQDVAFSDEDCPYFMFPVNGGTYNAVNKKIGKHLQTPFISSDRICIKSCGIGKF